MTWPVKEVDGGVQDENGVWFATIQDFVETEICGLCGCGYDDKFKWLQDMLKCCDRDMNGGQFPEDVLSQYIAAHPDRAAHVLLHLLNDKELLEHGGSVGGSWTTDLGDAVIQSVE